MAQRYGGAHSPGASGPAAGADQGSRPADMPFRGARRGRRAHNRLADGVRTPVLADLREVKLGANREARSHYVSDESAEFKSGMAMLVSSSMQRMVGNIFLKLNRPPYPTRLFREETAAVQWLKQLSEDG